MLIFILRAFVNLYCKLTYAREYVRVMTEKVDLYYLDNICLMKGQNLFEDHFKGLIFWSVSIIGLGLPEFSSAWLLACEDVFAIVVVVLSV